MSQQLPKAASELLRTPLTVEQRLELIGELWDGIPDSFDELALPEWHRQELERRLAAADADPDAAIPWEQVKKRLREKS
jgi:putative addiction module component (TIGR02574 family)